MIGTIRELFTPATVVVTECRQCGTTVDNTTISCPNCGADSIATYIVD